MTVRHAETPRSFGLAVGGALTVLALFQLWRHHLTAAISLEAVGAVLLVCGLAFPAILTRPSRLWWRFAHGLAAINARILLAALFFVALVPVSLAWRLLGKDPLDRRRERWPGWTDYPRRYRDRTHYRQMY